MKDRMKLVRRSMCVAICAAMIVTVFPMISGESSALEGPTITVTYPNGGETWYLAGTYDVTWTSENCSDIVRIGLMKDDSLRRYIASSTENDGLYTWTVDTDLEPGSTYKVSVLCSIPEWTEDRSDENFTILAPANPTIKVLAPNGGETWNVGSAYAINWMSYNVTGDVCIELYKGGSYYSTIASSTPDDEVHVWNVGAGTPSGSDYSIRISGVSTQAEDFSDGYFSIVQTYLYWEKCVLPIDGYPPGDYYCDFYELEYDDLPGGHVDQINDTDDYGYHMMGVSTETYTVSSAGGISVSGWFSMYDTFTPYYQEGRRYARVYVLDEAATTVLAYADALNWTDPVNTWIYVEDLVISGLTPDSTVSIGVGRTDVWEYNNWQLVAEWAGVEVEPWEPPSITVTSPDGGEMWILGSTHSITWTWTGSPGDYVKIELYRGTTLTSTIASSTYNDGSHSWSISTTLKRGDDYRIKISSTSTSAYDFSDDYFTLKKPSGGGGGGPPGSPKDMSADMLDSIESAMPQSSLLASIDWVCRG